MRHTRKIEGEVEVIEFEGVYYPTRCSYCSLPIKDSAIVLPPTRQIFHDEDCVSFYIGLHARNINHIRIREEGGNLCVIPNYPPN